MQYATNDSISQTHLQFSPLFTKQIGLIGWTEWEIVDCVHFGMNFATYDTIWITFRPLQIVQSWRAWLNIRIEYVQLANWVGNACVETQINSSYLKALRMKGSVSHLLLAQSCIFIVVETFYRQFDGGTLSLTSHLPFSSLSLRHFKTNLEINNISMEALLCS